MPVQALSHVSTGRSSPDSLTRLFRQKLGLAAPCPGQADCCPKPAQTLSQVSTSASSTRQKLGLAAPAHEGGGIVPLAGQALALCVLGTELQG